MYLLFTLIYASFNFPLFLYTLDNIFPDLIPLPHHILTLSLFSSHCSFNLLPTLTLERFSPHLYRATHFLCTINQLLAHPLFLLLLYIYLCLKYLLPTNNLLFPISISFWPLNAVMHHIYPPSSYLQIIHSRLPSQLTPTTYSIHNP